MNERRILAALGLVAAVTGTATAAPDSVEHRKVVDGFVINLGVVPAAALLRADAYERAVHRGAASQAPQAGQPTHHVVVGVTEARTGTPVGDARVTLELVDPRGGVQRQALERGNAGGVPDYSALFRFGWSGDYRLRVRVARAGVEPVAATFTWVQNY